MAPSTRSEFSTGVIPCRFFYVFLARTMVRVFGSPWPPLPPGIKITKHERYTPIPGGRGGAKPEQCRSQSHHRGDQRFFGQSFCPIHITFGDPPRPGFACSNRVYGENFG